MDRRSDQPYDPVAAVSYLTFAHPGQAGLDPDLVARLESIGVPLTILSGHRTEEHNRQVGGVPGSLHIPGLAADISLAGRGEEERAQLIQQLLGAGVPRFGLYSDKGDLLHVDMGGGGDPWFMYDRTNRNLASAPEYFQSLAGNADMYFDQTIPASGFAQFSPEQFVAQTSPVSSPGLSGAPPFDLPGLLAGGMTGPSPMVGLMNPTAPQLTPVDRAAIGLMALGETIGSPGRANLGAYLPYLMPWGSGRTGGASSSAPSSAKFGTQVVEQGTEKVTYLTQGGVPITEIGRSPRWEPESDLDTRLKEAQLEEYQAKPSQDPNIRTVKGPQGQEMSVVWDSVAEQFKPITPVGGWGPAPTDPDKTFSQEETLHDDYRMASSEYSMMLDQYAKVADFDPRTMTGIMDRTLVVVYSKMLDPTSVVMEGEDRIVRQTGQVMPWITELYQKAIGEGLSVAQRSALLRETHRLATQAQNTMDSVWGFYKDRSDRESLDYRNVVGDRPSPPKAPIAIPTSTPEETSWLTRLKERIHGPPEPDFFDEMKAAP